jgi:hypothetical protein
MQLPFPSGEKFPFGCDGYERLLPLVKGNGFILVSEFLPGIISAPSKVAKCIKGSILDLSHWYTYICYARYRFMAVLLLILLCNGRFTYETAVRQC